MSDTDWMSHPGHPCAADPDLFLPADNAGRAEIAKAKGCCFGCPDRVACLGYAMTHDVDGIWGATTRQERRGRASNQPIVHGLASSYRHRGCRCQLCRDAWAVCAKKKRAAQKG